MRITCLKKSDQGGASIVSRAGWFVLYLLSAVVMSSAVAEAHEVSKINRAKGMVLVTSSAEVRKGERACILTPAGKQVTCGTIGRVRKTDFVLDIEDKQRMRRIKRGFPVEVKDGKGTTGDERESKKGRKTDGAARTASQPTKSSSKTVIRVQYLPALIGPTTYNKVTYVPPANANNAAGRALWEADSKISSAFLGFGGSVSVPIGSGGLAVNPGFRYRIYTGGGLDSDYDPVNKLRYAQITQKMTAIGLWLDVTALKIAGLGLDAGLDFEMSTLDMTSLVIDEATNAEADLTSATSKLNVISLRVGAQYDLLIFGPAGLNLGTTAMLPLTGLGKNFSANVDGDRFAATNPDTAADLEAAMGHNKSGFAVEFSLGLAFGF